MMLFAWFTYLCAPSFDALILTREGSAALHSPPLCLLLNILSLPTHSHIPVLGSTL